MGIVAALAEFPALEIVESCEGYSDKSAWLYFRYGEYWNRAWTDLAGFVWGYLSPGLTAAVGDDASVRIRISPSGQMFGELSVRPGAEHRVQTALRMLAPKKGLSPAGQLAFGT